MARDRRFADVGAQDASRSGARHVRDARRSDLAGVPTCSRSSNDRGRLLYGGHGLTATPLRALLHRVGQPPRAPGRLYGAPKRNLGDPADSPIRLDGYPGMRNRSGFSSGIATRNSPQRLTSFFAATV